MDYEELQQNYTPVYRERTAGELVLIRLAQVCWWAGTLTAADIAIGVVISFGLGKDGIGVAAFSIILGGIFFTIARTLSFILGGGFWDFPTGR